MNRLNDFGWNDARQAGWDTLELNGLQPARVIADFGTSLKIATPEIITAELSGKLAYYKSRDDAPKVGDWVAVNITDGGNATIESIVLRSNEIARKVAGKRVLKQVIAANVDIAFILLALDNDFNIERLKRYLYQLSVSKIDAVIVLNKADKTDDLESYLSQLHSFNVPVITTVAKEGKGIGDIKSKIKPGRTAILLGSSGVGKSTLTNKLLGREAQETRAVRESDSSGMHTTVHREIFMLPGGGLLVDTPGIRELQLWGTEEELDDDYDDIVELSAKCKYTTCGHGSEEGCAIITALADGTLERSRYANYLKMKVELAKLEIKQAARFKYDNRRRRKSFDN